MPKGRITWQVIAEVLRVLAAAAAVLAGQAAAPIIAPELAVHRLVRVPERLPAVAADGLRPSVSKLCLPAFRTWPVPLWV